MTSGRWRLVAAAVVPVIAAIAAVATLATTDAPDTPSGGGTAGRGHGIVIRNFTYAPSPLVVDRGATVTVTNADGTKHSVTADDGAFDTGDLDGGARARFRIDRPGKYSYHCDIHDYMRGTIEVRR